MSMSIANENSIIQSSSLIIVLWVSTPEKKKLSPLIFPNHVKIWLDPWNPKV